jgi:RNA-directed DNA polymerase
MTKTNNSLDFTSLEALEVAFYGASRGKRYKTYSAFFNYQRLEVLIQLQDELRTRCYQPKPHRRFMVNDPKKRLIDAPHFRDRIVHHAVCAVLKEVYEPCFVHDSYACREAKGSHAALRRVQHYVRWQTDKSLHVLHLDVSKYYASVNHDVLKRILRKKITDPLLLNALDTIIASYHSGDEHDDLFATDSPYHTRGYRGIPIGNLTSQIFGNIYLHEVDLFIKRTLKAKRYIRYMDDLMIISDNKQQLRDWQHQITDFLRDELCLTVHPRKTRLYPAKDGVSFVGYVIWRHKIRVRSSTVKLIKQRWKRMLKQYQRGDIDKQDLAEVFYAWVAHLKHASPRQTNQLIRKLYSQYQEINPNSEEDRRSV